MRAVLASAAVCVLLTAPLMAAAQYDPYFGTYDTPYVDYSSPTWTRTPESVTRPSGGSGSTGGSTGGTTSGTTSGASAPTGFTGAASITIPAGATEVWVQPGPDLSNRKVFYAPEGTVEEPRAAADTTLRKIYVRSPLGKPNYTRPIGAFDTYDKGYIFTDKLTDSAPVPARAVAPTPSPAKPLPLAPTTPRAQPATPAAPAQPATPVTSGEQPAQPAAPEVPTVPLAPQLGASSAASPGVTAPPPTSSQRVVRRIARGITTFFSGIVRWFQHL